MEIKNKEDLIKYLENYEITYDYEQDYTDIKNACIDYMNNIQDWSIDYLFEDYIDYEIAEEYAKHELETGGLIRLYYFLGNCNFNNEIFKINGYGNLEDISIDDLEILKEEILDTLKEC